MTLLKTTTTNRKKRKQTVVNKFENFEGFHPEGAVDRDDVLLAVHNRRSLAVALDEAAQPLPSLRQDLPALGSPLVEVKVDNALTEAF